MQRPRTEAEEAGADRRIRRSAGHAILHGFEDLHAHPLDESIRAKNSTARIARKSSTSPLVNISLFGSGYAMVFDEGLGLTMVGQAFDRMVEEGAAGAPVIMA